MQQHHSGGGGTSSNPYKITSAEELAYLAKLINTGQTSYNGKYYQLQNDIDLSAHYWVPIGCDSSHYFYGTFDGQYHEIKNLTIDNTDTSYDYVGLFGRCSSGALSIKSLYLNKPDITDIKATYASFLVAYAYNATSIEDIEIYNSPIYSWGNYDNIKDNNSKSGSCFGGFVGYSDDQLTLSRCNLIDHVIINTVKENTGGAVGLARNYRNHSYNEINIILSHIIDYYDSTSGPNVGGLIGKFNMSSSTYTLKIDLVSVYIHELWKGYNGSIINSSGLIGWFNATKSSYNSLLYISNSSASIYSLVNRTSDFNMLVGKWTYTPSSSTLKSNISNLQYDNGKYDDTIDYTIKNGLYSSGSDDDESVCEGSDYSSQVSGHSFATVTPDFGVSTNFDGNNPVNKHIFFVAYRIALRKFSIGIYSKNPDLSVLNYYVVELNSMYLRNHSVYPVRQISCMFGLYNLSPSYRFFYEDIVAGISYYITTPDFNLPLPNHSSYLGFKFERRDITNDNKYLYEDNDSEETGDYYYAGDGIYNVSTDLMFWLKDASTTKTISYKKDSSTIVEVEDIYYKTNSSTIKTVNDYKYKKDSSTIV